MVAGLTITAGTLGDRWGRRRLFAGAAGFLFASLLAAFAVNPAMLIASRALLGVAGATLMPSTLALISTMFTDAGQRGRAISLWATCQFAGAALGPVFGGLLLDHFWWGSVFLLAVPLMLVLLVFGPFVLPEFRSRTPHPMDLASVALSLGTILPLVYGIKNLAVGEALTVPTVALVVGGTLGACFVRRQSRLDDPLMDLALLRRAPLAITLAGLLLGGILLAGVGLLVTQYLQSVLGFSAATAAWLFTPMGLAMAMGTLLAPRLARRVGRAQLISGGMLLSAVGAAVLAVDAGLPGVLVGITVLAFGFGPLFALGTDLVIGSVPPEHAGAAASLAESSNHTGGNLGIALLGTVAAVVYRSGLPPGTDDAVRETIAGANEALPEGGAMLRVAHEAFTHGLHVAAVIAAGLCLLVAAMTWRLPRD
ncbi:MFS transporter [Glycomyces sp. YM15]|uniref:MFS transporter n=1 Tax=Glycomyces sp. YM15 TaxID=2800446 RepID=UPI00196470B0|nr:MFS transporter [Glycomyces sp. YM15]